MLVLRFEIDGQAYGLPCRQVERVVPLVALRRVPLGPPYLVGLALLEGSAIPVFDLSVLAGGAPCPDRLSTRLIIVTLGAALGAATPHTVALMAERITETVHITPADVAPPPLNLPEAPFLEGLVADAPTDGHHTATERAGQLLQLIDVQQLVPAEVLTLLALQDAEMSPS